MSQLLNYQATELLNKAVAYLKLTLKSEHESRLDLTKGDIGRTLHNTLRELAGEAKWGSGRIAEQDIANFHQAMLTRAAQMKEADAPAKAAEFSSVANAIAHAAQQLGCTLEHHNPHALERYFGKEVGVPVRTANHDGLYAVRRGRENPAPAVPASKPQPAAPEAPRPVKAAAPSAPRTHTEKVKPAGRPAAAKAARALPPTDKEMTTALDTFKTFCTEHEVELDQFVTGSAKTLLALPPKKFNAMIAEAHKAAGWMQYKEEAAPVLEQISAAYKNYQEQHAASARAL